MGRFRIFEGYEKRSEPVTGTNLFSVLFLSIYLGSVAAASEYAEQEDEQVDEVKVEVEGSESGQFIAERGVEIGHSHALDLLGVPSSESNEYEYAGEGDHPHQGSASDEYVDDGCYDETEEGHDEICAHLGEVALSEIAVNTHGSKYACRDEEGVENRTEIVDHEYGRQRGSHHGRE